jgi:hypothetical protein
MSTLLTSPAAWAIVGGEVGFWILLALGLTARYALRRPRLGGFLLALTPVLDLAVVVVGVADLHGGATAGTPHVLAAIYVGLSVGFGPRTIRAVDARVAHRFRGAPKPPPAPRHGPERVRRERDLFGRWLVTAAIAAVLIAVMWAAATGSAAALTIGLIALAGTTVWWGGSVLAITAAEKRRDRGARAPDASGAVREPAGR